MEKFGNLSQTKRWKATLNTIAAKYRRPALLVASLVLMIQLASLYIDNFQSAAPFFPLFDWIFSLFSFGLFVIPPYVFAANVLRKGDKTFELKGWTLGLLVNVFLILISLPLNIVDILLKALTSSLQPSVYWIYLWGSIGGSVMVLIEGMIFGWLAEFIAKR